MASIREVPSGMSRFERIGAHTHIKGLGLDENGRAVKIKNEILRFRRFVRNGVLRRYLLVEKIRQTSS